MGPYWEKPILKETPIRSAGEIIDLVLKNEKGEKLKVDDFKGIFGEEEVKKDKSLVEAIKRNFEKGLDYLSTEDRDKIKAGKKKKRGAGGYISRSNRTK